MVYLLQDSRIFGFNLNPFDTYELSVDVCGGDFLAIKWLNRAPPKSMLFTEMCTYRSEQRQKLRRYRSNPIYTHRAASIGNLKCLQYLHKNRWDWETCNAAADNGHPPASCRLIVLNMLTKRAAYGINRPSVQLWKMAN